MIAALVASFAVAAPGAAEADTRVTCRMHAEPSPSGPFESRDGARAWTAQLNGARLELITTPSASSRIRLADRRVYGWKTPFALTAGGDVVVRIVGGGGRFQYGRSKTWRGAARSARFTACPADEPAFASDGVVGPITGWGGGLYTTSRRACLRLRVTSAQAPGERAATLTVPLGRRRC